MKNFTPLSHNPIFMQKGEGGAPQNQQKNQPSPNFQFKFSERKPQTKNNAELIS